MSFADSVHFFFSNNVKQKISMVNDVGELVVFHGKYFIKSCMKYMLEKNINAFV